MTFPSNSSRDDVADAGVDALGSESAPVGQLRAELVLALGEIVPQMPSPETRVVVRDEQWAAALVPFCASARRLRLPIELVIVVCKEAWYALPAARLIPDAEREALMSRLVTLCIETYFAFPATAAGS